MLSSSFCLLLVLTTAFAVSDWKLIDSDIATSDLGVAFVNEFVGYTAGDGNGVGPEIFKSVDGGAHFEACNASFGIDVLLLDCDATENTVVVSSVFGELYSVDSGKTFKRSVGGGTSQSVRYVGLNGDGGEKYGVTGQYGAKEGVAISVNGGKSFTVYPVPLFTAARYGAFPNDTNWLVAAGQWPDSTQSSPTGGKVRRPGRTRRSVFLHEDGTYAYPSRIPTNDGWSAQLSLTRNGGKTWTTVFAENSTFYFNGVDCSPNITDNCCAVGEGDDGARIYCTNDGGLSWNRTFWSPATKNQGYSLIEIRYSSAKEIWAIGAVLNTAFPTAWFVHSLDGGRTWTPDTTTDRGYYALSISMVSSQVGYVAADNLITQESSIFKYNP